MTRYLLAAGLAAVAWALTLSLYVTAALLTGHQLSGWLVVATVAAAVVLWVETARALR